MMPYSTIVSCATLPEVTWQPESLCSYPETLTVFRFAVSSGADFADILAARLSPDEISRAQRYRRPADRQRFTYARGVQRMLLGKYTGQKPEAIQFVSDANRKTHLLHKSSLQFNVSHAGNWVVWAISQTRVGIDVEEMKVDFAFEEIATHYFSPQEQRLILDSNHARQLFYQLWTRKEALVKATGQGLTDSLARIPCLDGDHYPDDNLLAGNASWMVRSFTVADNYPGAVAYLTSSDPINFYTIDGAFLAQNAQR